MLRRKLPYDHCQRRTIPARLRAEIVLRQEGRCADCASRLIPGSFVLDHRPPLALRALGEDPNDPDRLAAICQRCDEHKTPRDLKAIAKTKRLAQAEAEFVERLGEKRPGRRAPTRKQWAEIQRDLEREREKPRLE